VAAQVFVGSLVVSLREVLVETGALAGVGGFFSLLSMGIFYFQSKRNLSAVSRL
jgi:hypothetical protein